MVARALHDPRRSSLTSMGPTSSACVSPQCVLVLRLADHIDFVHPGDQAGSPVGLALALER